VLVSQVRSAGVSLWRLSLPYFAVGFVLSVTSFLINEFWVPDSADAGRRLLEMHQTGPGLLRPPVTRGHRAEKLIDEVGLKEYAKHRPAELSGGQRQRVAVGRAIVRKPEAFLFDEPLSNLDAKMRVQMRTEISKLHTRLETTMIYVTHDQIEAMQSSPDYKRPSRPVPERVERNLDTANPSVRAKAPLASVWAIRWTSAPCARSSTPKRISSSWKAG